MDILSKAGVVNFHLLVFASGLALGAYSPLISNQRGTNESRSNYPNLLIPACICAAGALGSVLAGLLLLPILGFRHTLIIAASLLAVNLPALLIGTAGNAARPRPSRLDRLTKYAGIAMLWCSLLALIISNTIYLTADKAAEQRARLRSAAADMAPDTELVDAVLADGVPVEYYQNPQDETIVLSTESLAPGVRGYNDTIDMAVKLSSEGEILDLQIMRHFETPTYMRDVMRWLPNLRGRNIFREDIMAEVDAVSGATASSEAILRSLQITGSRLSDVEGIAEQSPTLEFDWTYDRHFLFFVGMTFIALIMRYNPKSSLRKFQLLAVLGVGGLMFNTQYSLDNTLQMLGGQIPSIALQGGFILAVGVPLLVLLLGNIYCGHLCPFGALQELLYDIKPKRLRISPDKSLWRAARWIKYMVLFAAVIVYSISRSREIGEADPLVNAFSDIGNLFALSTLAILLLAVFFNRFWCRNLCPVGAFLSLLNKVRLLRFVKFRIYPGHCDLGVRSRRDYDCINCDRCRMPGAKRPRSNRSAAFLLILPATLFFIQWLRHFF